MDREIKFRVWDKKEKRMWYPELGENNWAISDNGTVYRIYYDELDGEDFIEYEDAIVMQSTGLTDKNRKEIYDGDIVKGRRGIGEVRFGRFLHDFDEGDFVIGWYIYVYGENSLNEKLSEYYQDNLGSSDYLRYRNNTNGDNLTVEVIGNIYENLL